MKDASTKSPEKCENICLNQIFDASIILCHPDSGTGPSECADTKRALSALESEFDHSNDQRTKLESDLASLHAMCATLDAQVRLIGSIIFVSPSAPNQKPHHAFLNKSFVSQQEKTHTSVCNLGQILAAF